MPITKSKKLVHYVVSYIPLLTGNAGQTLDLEPSSMRAFSNMINALPDGRAEAILWGVSPEGDPWPIFVLDEAEQIFNHIVDWSEGSPTSWFNFHILSREKDYAIALIPKVEKSVERYKLAWELKNGEPIAQGMDYQILYKGVYFSSEPGAVSTTFKTVQPLLKPNVKIGFVERSSLGLNLEETPENLDLKSRVAWMGPFETQTNAHPYMTSLFPKVVKSRARLKAERRARR
jgi:hypothetical protein